MYAAVASGRVKPEKKKADVPAEPSQVQQPAEPTQQPEPNNQTQQQQEEIVAPPTIVEYIGNNGGSFANLNQGSINAIASFLTPVSHIAVGVTCHYLNKAFLNQNTWKLQRFLPRSMQPIFKIDVKIPIRKKGEPEDSGFAIDEVESDQLLVEGTDSVLVSSSFFRKEARKQHLQKVWKHQGSKIQKARDKLWEEESKKPKDILQTTDTVKPGFEMKFPGGFVLYYREPHKKTANTTDLEVNDVLFASAKDLTDLATWLEGAQKLLQGEKKFEVPTFGNTVLSVSRFGRGGSQVVVKIKSTNQKVFFQLSDFLLHLRSAAKEFIPVLGRVVMLINQDVKNVPKEDNESYLEYEKFFNGAFKMAKINSAISKIKELLEKGAIPHSNVQHILKKKREEKKETRAQIEIENSNILDFIYSNLPSDLNEARKQAHQQTEEARQLREQAIAQAAIEKERRRNEKAAQREAEKLKRESKYIERNKSEEEEKTPKTKTKLEKTTDDQGFTTLNTKYTKIDEKGHVVQEFTASGKPDKTETKKKDKKDKKGNSPLETQVSPSLQNNPFAVVVQAGGLESQQEIQAKKNAKKGEVRNQENNEAQKERAPAPLPPKVAPKPKVKPTKKKSKKNKVEPDSSPHDSALTTLPSAINQRIVVACAALAVSVLSYFLLL